MDTDRSHANLRLHNGDAKSDEVKTPFLIGVAGGTASGKSTVCKKIMEQLGQADMDHTQRQVVTISQDSFYRELTAAEKSKAQKGLFNFDHPDAFNEQLMYETLQAILKGIRVEIPSYDYRTNSLDYVNKLTIYPADVVLFEGILVFYFPKIRDLFHMKLFVDTDSDTRLARRVPRDINERGRDLDAVLTQYMTFVKPAFEEFCSPTKKFADVIIPRGADNTVAIDLIVHHIGEILRPGGSTNNLNTAATAAAASAQNVSHSSGNAMKLAIDLIVQHIRDFLNNRSHCGSTNNISLFMHVNAEDPSANNNTMLLGGTHNNFHVATSTANGDSAYSAIRRFSMLSKELSMRGNFFFEKNQNLTQH